MRPDGAIIDTSHGVVFTPFWIAYSLEEGGAYHMMGCHSEEIADLIIKQYKEHGTMTNPSVHPDKQLALKPYGMMKLRTSDMYTWVPGN